MKNCIAVLLLVAMVAMAVDLQVGIGAQMVQEIGEAPYSTTVIHGKLGVPVISLISIENSVIFESYNTTDTDMDEFTLHHFASFWSIGIQIDSTCKMSTGYGIRNEGSEYISSLKYGWEFAIANNKYIELIMTYAIEGEGQPFGCGAVFSIGT